MRVMCVSNKGSELKRQRYDEGYTLVSNFYLEVGHEYRVHAMALWESGLVILVVDQTGRPRWQPIELFAITDHGISAQWEFDVWNESDDEVKAVWGYPSLVQDPSHHDALSELEPAALAVFWNEVEGDKT